jgi:hypothetical protein
VAAGTAPGGAQLARTGQEKRQRKPSCSPEPVARKISSGTQTVHLKKGSGKGRSWTSVSVHEMETLALALSQVYGGS